MATFSLSSYGLSSVHKTERPSQRETWTLFLFYKDTDTIIRLGCNPRDLQLTLITS